MQEEDEEEELLNGHLMETTKTFYRDQREEIDKVDSCPLLFLQIRKFFQQTLWILELGGQILMPEDDPWI